ncbi:hypothetical protein AWC04_08490 [Mycolicibacterium fallax]|uniref:Uncharacterized protein n=1 Tax=Mycolicibacterium fallax TaxID=1793 RepID=A0A1X1RFK6_MYCFA|nr:hypothetical protein AWC04_08490 [Mycolicibacterium fallax]
MMEPIPEGGGTLTHQPGAEETVCNDTLPSILIPADHPDPNSVIEQIMEKSFRDALAQPDPGFPWETVGVTAAATLVLVAVGFAGYRFVQSRRDASRPAHTITGDES